jgi:hypothetical protein
LHIFGNKWEWKWVWDGLEQLEPRVITVEQPYAIIEQLFPHPFHFQKPMASPALPKNAHLSPADRCNNNQSGTKQAAPIVHNNSQNHSLQ